MGNIKLLSYVFGVAYLLSACESGERPISVEKNIGYFVSNFNTSVEYACQNKREILNNSGKFECASFPISFYMDETKIGEISSIHSDGYVYPQDIIRLETRAPVYTSENSIRFLVVE
ncbi:MAG: Unknown protein [uncultured Sulfurovum sp.]|uniref:Lipoprotein n=1 Tax=uncultured Sulfurovum sp. TaxID=269237 RepID=A0A6S6TDT6_9BACT|nr:MAG: Unknown protein [uncultured Sulfurovum sp.]